MTGMDGLVGKWCFGYEEDGSFSGELGTREEAIAAAKAEADGCETAWIGRWALIKASTYWMGTDNLLENLEEGVYDDYEFEDACFQIKDEDEFDEMVRAVIDEYISATMMRVEGIQEVDLREVEEDVSEFLRSRAQVHDELLDLWVDKQKEKGKDTMATRAAERRLGRR